MGDPWLIGLMGLAVLIGAIVALAKLVDLWRRRRRERASVRGVVTDALLGDPGLTGATVVAKVRIPFWQGAPATVVLTGRVRDPETRATALRVARKAASSVRRDFTLQDLLREGHGRTATDAA